MAAETFTVLNNHITNNNNSLQFEPACNGSPVTKWTLES